MRNWLNMQDEDCMYMLADLHSLTSVPDPIELQQSVRLMGATLLGIGLDPEKVTIFRQSNVSAHSELAWILNCHTPMSWLSRMTQFKDKSSLQSSPSTGLYTYPALMAADILLYQATHVPCGADQTQHLEFTRDLALKVNATCNQSLFTVPSIVYPECSQVSRVMSLKDGKKKMSKSDPSAMSRLELTDSADEISTKIRKAKSDSLGPISMYIIEGSRPEVENLLALHASFLNVPVDRVAADFNGKNVSELKVALIESAIHFLGPITQRIQHLVDDRSYIDDVLNKGSEKASAVAQKTLQQVKQAHGLL